MSTQGGPAVGSLSKPGHQYDRIQAVKMPPSQAALREAERLMERSEGGTETPIISASASPWSVWGRLAEAIEHTLLPELDRLEQEASCA